MEIVFTQIVISVIFLSVVFLHLTKKNSAAVMLYLIESLALSLLLFKSYALTFSPMLLVVAVVTLIIKAIWAPRFFMNLINTHELKFSSTTYLSVPFTLIAIAALTALASAKIFVPVTSLSADNSGMIAICLAIMLISVFLIINRKGVMSQIIGILSLENGIVAFGVLAGLEQSPALQIGIMFDILIWILIATVFASMIYRHFGSLDVTNLNDLKE